jgi:hypothetical protein
MKKLLILIIILMVPLVGFGNCGTIEHNYKKYTSVISVYWVRAINMEKGKKTINVFTTDTMSSWVRLDFKTKKETVAYFDNLVIKMNQCKFK